MIDLYNCPACNSRVHLFEHHIEEWDTPACISVIGRGCYNTYDDNDNKIDVSKPDCYRLYDLHPVKTCKEPSESDSEYLLKIANIAEALKTNWNLEVDLYITNKEEEYRRSIEEIAEYVPLAQSTKKSRGL